MQYINSAKNNINENIASAKDEINNSTMQYINSAKNNINENINNLSNNTAIGFNDLKNMFNEEKNLAAVRYANLDSRTFDINNRVFDINEKAQTLLNNSSTYFDVLKAQSENLNNAIMTALASTENRVIETNARLIEANTRLIELQNSVNNQTTLMNSSFANVNNSISNLGNNLETYKTQIGNNINSTKQLINEAKAQIIGTDTTKTLTYVSSQAQNTLANTKAISNLIGTATDNENTNTLFGRVAKISSQISAIDNKLNTIDTKVGQVLNNVTVVNDFGTSQKIALINHLMSIYGTTESDTAGFVQNVIDWLDANNLIK